MDKKKTVKDEDLKDVSGGSYVGPRPIEPGEDEPGGPGPLPEPEGQPEGGSKDLQE